MKGLDFAIEAFFYVTLRGFVRIRTDYFSPFVFVFTRSRFIFEVMNKVEPSSPKFTFEFGFPVSIRPSNLPAG